MQKRFLVVNSGSSSERFSLYEGEEEICALYFEEVKESLSAFNEAKQILTERGLLQSLDGVLVRVVAAGEYFTRHHIVDDETIVELEKARLTNPLHVPKTLEDIKNVRATFGGVPILIMSDSEFLTRASRRDDKYALPAELGFRRYGAHGLSYGYVMGEVKKRGALEDKMIVCHLGSGCSVTGFIDGEPAYTSMGETPLEGLMSSTRAGSVDPTIGVLLGAEFGAEEAIKILNQKSGLLALAGTDNLREVIERVEDDGARMAYEMFIDGVVGKIGEFAAKMGGVDAIIFTGTIGERSFVMRRSVISRLEFMGFEVNEANEEIKEFTNVAAGTSKPIYVIPANEAAYMVEEASKLLG